MTTENRNRNWAKTLSGLAIGASLCLVLAAVYVTQAPLGNARAGDSAQTIAAIGPLAKGEVAAFVVADEAKPAPDISFVSRDGTRVSLADWKGRTVLLNLWATWCTPCKREMPELDALQKELGSDAFEVVAVNVDRGGPAKGEKFYADTKLEALKYYHDDTSKVFRQVRGIGMPVTLLVDANGMEVGRLNGPAVWHSDDAVALIKAALAAAKQS